MQRRAVSTLIGGRTRFWGSCCSGEPGGPGTLKARMVEKPEGMEGEPLLSPSLLALNLSQDQSLVQ